MSNIRAITGSSKIVHRNQGGGSKLQGIPSSTNLNTWAHVSFRNRNVVCPCKREYIFCMNQLGGVGAGGIPGRSYAFAPGADGTHKPFYCGHRFGYHLGNNKHLIYPKKDKEGFVTIVDKFGKSSNFFIQSLESFLVGFVFEFMNVDKTYIVSSTYNFSINKTYKISILTSANISITFFIEKRYKYKRRYKETYVVKLKSISRNLTYIRLLYNSYSSNIEFDFGSTLNGGSMVYIDPKNFRLSVLE